MIQMAKIKSRIRKEPYKVEILSPTGNVVIADEPVEMGGMDLGFSPKELLASALAACTSATVKMFADRKKWDLDEVNVQIELDHNAQENKTVIHRSIEFVGELDEKQKKRLLVVAGACPIHKILNHPIDIITQIEKFN